MMQAAAETPQAPHRAMRIYTTAMAALATFASCWIVFLMLLICADVLGLKLFARPIYGVIELTEKSIVPVVFLSLAWAAYRGMITRIDFIHAPLARYHPFSGHVLDLAFVLLAGALMAVLTSLLLGDLQSHFSSGTYFGARSVFSMPLWPFTLATFIGVAALTIELARQGLGALRAAARALPKARALEIALLAIGLLAFALVVGSIIQADLSRITLGVLSILFLFLLLMFGMPVAFVLCVIGVAMVWLARDNPTVAFRTLRVAATGTIDKFDFAVVPLFVLMGLLTSVADIGRDAYRVAAWWTRKMLGGLGIATVAANTVFAAVTGISIASAAVFSRVAVPQMMAHGYTGRFAAGTVAGSSILGMLLPPSLLLIIFAFVTESSVGKLFLAAVIPGLLLAILFCATILLLARFAPDFVGRSTGASEPEPETLLSSARLLLPIAVLVFVIMGGIYLGWFTPTQAGAVGALAAFILTWVRGKLSWAAMREVLTDTGQISVTVLFLIIGASVFSRGLVMTTLPMGLVNLATDLGLGFWMIVILYMGLVIVMGMFLDSTSIIVITVPLVLPLVVAQGLTIIGPDVVIWFGIVTIVAVEMGLLTPPFGISAFVVKAALGSKVTLAEIYVGALPYLAAMLVLLALLIALPWLVIGIF